MESQQRMYWGKETRYVVDPRNIASANGSERLLQPREKSGTIYFHGTRDAEHPNITDVAYRGILAAPDVIGKSPTHVRELRKVSASV